MQCIYIDMWYVVFLKSEVKVQTATAYRCITYIDLLS